MQLLWLAIFIILHQTTHGCVFLKLKNGLIKGRISLTPEKHKIFFAFQEIPYALPPIGNLRFQPPQPYPKWKNIIDATRNTKICYQSTQDSPMETEDCLYLNVYTPKLPSIINKKLLPVIVYIYGGGFITGDATHTLYGPEFLIDYDVIVVTLNYRLGPFGFISTADEILPGNNGLKDQLLALKWVNENIKTFGGDKNKITLIGQSAGAASVAYHLLSKKSEGLFRAAIMESGSALCSFSYQRNPSYFALKTATYVNNASLVTNSSEEIFQVLVNAPADKIDKVSKRITADEETFDNVQWFQGYYYAPVMEKESENAFLTEKMYETLKNGQAHKVPIIMGINSEEGLSQTTNVTFLQRWMALYDLYLGNLVPKNMNIGEGSVLEEVGGKIRELYSGENLLQSDPSYGLRIISDTTFTRPVIKHAELQAKYSEVYFYEFDYDGKMGNVSIIVEGADRIGHNEETAYLWRVSNDMFNNYDLSIYPQKDIITHKRLLTLWTNFVKTLYPTFQDDDLLENITWPRVTVNNGFKYLYIGEHLEVRTNPKEEVYRGWNQIYEEYGIGPYDTF